MAQLKLGTLIAGNTVWHSGNDGSASGLDADLLDGQHGSYYQTALGYTPVNITGDSMTGALSINTPSITTSIPILSLSQTWNNAATQFTALSLNAIDTASTSTSLLLDLKVGSVSKLNITKAGDVYSAGFVGIGSPASYSGMTRNGNNLIFYTSSQAKLNISTGAGAIFYNNIAFSTDIYNPDLFLYREAANTLTQRNGLNAQSFKVYNTYTDASNYERGAFSWNSNVLEIGTEALGTGTRRPIKLNYTTTIDGGSRTNVPALSIINVGAGAGGFNLGIMQIGHGQDNARVAALYIPNKGIGYNHAGSAISGQGAHRFSGDANTGTGTGINGSIVDILAPSTATNIFQCRQTDETLVFNVAYNGTTTIAKTTAIAAELTTVASTTQTQIASFPVSSFRSAKMAVQAYDTITGEVQITELLIAHNGTTAYATEYGMVYTGAAFLASFDVSIVASAVKILATRTTANSTQYKVSETLMLA